MHEHIWSLAPPVADQNGLLNFTTLNISIYDKNSVYQEHMNNNTTPQYDSHMAKRTPTANLQA